MKTQAVSYLRVSGKGQVQGDGFPRQRAACAAFAKSAKLELVEEFRDEGISGTTELEGRPGLAALLDRIENNGVKVVVIERADRLARDLMVSEVILAQFAAAGAKVLTADGADLSSAADDPTRTLIRQVLAAVAQFDKSVVVLKLRAARERLRRKGVRVEGRKPYGFHPNERAIVAHMQALRAVSRDVRPSLADVAAQLNAEGHTTRYGKQWTPAGVFEALRTAAGKPRQRA
jgi:DNA invertase Pin-like site-specific DNA recombinase